MKTPSVASRSPGPKRKLLRACGCLALLVATCYFLLPKQPLLDGIAFSREVFDRNGERLAITLSVDDKYRLFTPLADISPEVIEATLNHEDRYFAKHPGCNPVALFRAAWRYGISGQRRVGASTITMQLARLRFRLQTRTIPGKLQQIYYALCLERHYSKEEIMEAYLNLAPYGGNLEGVGAASLAIFRKAPSALTKYEALALSVIPQSPARRGPLRDRENPSLQAAMARSGGSEAAGFHVILRGIPKIEAPHFVRRALRENNDRVVRTTLDLDIQRLAQSGVQSWLRTQNRLGLRNAAVEIFDWRKMETVARLGSANFDDVSICGQVDGTMARRSPGSTLKPFVYALAIQQGLIHPSSIVLDAPRYFSGYNPENSDREFSGPLHASEALARSRNVPAVELTQKLRGPGLYGFLQHAGFQLPKPSSWYGLSLTLGGAEIRMHDLVRLYAMLANHGSNGSQQLLTPEAAFLTLEMLGHVPPPAGYELHAPVYWKTGTSHGYRDAWSVGVCGPYVVAVWVGNFDGSSNPAFMGRIAAAPLFFQLLESMENRGVIPQTPHLPSPGANLRQVELCAASGGLPDKFCRHRTAGWFIPGVSPIASCKLHQEVIIEQESGMRLMTDDGSRPVRREIFEFWPKEIMTLFAKAGVARREPPPYLPGQINLSIGNGSLKIVSPKPGAVYTRLSGEGNDRDLALRVNGDAGSRRVYWFDGPRFLGSAPAGQMLRWLPEAGPHEIRAIDQEGRQAVAAIRVEVVGGG